MILRPTVLFGDDGSPAADRAWLWLHSQTWPGWRLQTLTAVAPPLGPPLPVERAEPHEWADPHPRRDFSDSCFAEVEHLLAEQDPRLLLERGASLVVIGPHDRHRRMGTQMPGTTEWLLREPRSPLVVARGGRPVHHVAVAFDGSAPARRAIEVLATLPWARALSITVLVIDDGHVDVDARLDEGAALVAPCSSSVEGRVERGAPARVVVEVLDSLGVDLAVLGTRGLRGVRRLRLGSTATAAARAARCAVLVAPTM